MWVCGFGFLRGVRERGCVCVCGSGSGSSFFFLKNDFFLFKRKERKEVSKVNFPNCRRIFCFSVSFQQKLKKLEN